METKSLDHTSLIPLYHQLKEILRDRIESGSWPPNEMIASEHQLMREYQVSRNTVKKAIEDLVQEGLLTRVQGKGTFVSLPKIEQSLSGFYSFSRVMKAKGFEPKDVIISIEKRPIPSSFVKYFDASPEEQVHELKRIRCAGDEPIIYERSYLPRSVIPALAKDDLANRSLYDFMEQEYGVVVSKAKETFEPVLIDSFESHYLNTKAGYPGLLLDRISYDISGRPVEYCRSVVRGDRCRFYTDLL